jgi:hypothetical protein
MIVLTRSAHEDKPGALFSKFTFSRLTTEWRCGIVGPEEEEPDKDERGGMLVIFLESDATAAEPKKGSSSRGLRLSAQQIHKVASGRSRQR